MSPSAKPRRLGLIFLGLGLMCLAIAAGSAIYSWNFLRTAERTTGVVIEMRESVDKEDNSRTYAPVFRFRDQSGAEHTVTSRYASNPPLHRVGESVSIRFQLDHPERARIDGFMNHWSASLISSPLGGIFAALGWAIWRAREAPADVAPPPV